MKLQPTKTAEQSGLKIVYVSISDLYPAEYNPRKNTDKQAEDLKKSLSNFDIVEPIVVNSAENRKNIIIGGHFRWKVAKELGYKEIPVVYKNIPDLEREKELNLRLNKNTGEWDWDLLSKFDEIVLADIGFPSEELDNIFDIEDTPEQFDLQKELQKLNITKINIQKGDIWQLGNSRLMCGDSTVEENILKLMAGEQANMCFTDPPYILDYLKGKKKHGKATEGFGAKRDRRYLETDVLPPDFTENWMTNIAKVQKEHFSIIVYENWKNIRTIWGEMEKYWKVKNMIVWHLPNRVQGFAAKYKFFNKNDIAMVGTSPNVDMEFNNEPEADGLQEEYETALYAISGKPHWEGYEKGKKIQPTDFIEFVASDEKNSGQGVVFGTKPIEILIPYIKVLTQRGDLIVEPFGGSGSTLIAAEKMKRRCFVMEKSPIYAEVIKHRWEKLTGQKGEKIL
ncbi:MAG: ParB N-terminal domain-containing protein [Patescibacteria group bacterium]|nr:ParB N-terminal domain-containing protein [Patescibacteria group bacterium]